MGLTAITPSGFGSSIASDLLWLERTCHAEAESDPLTSLSVVQSALVGAVAFAFTLFTMYMHVYGRGDPVKLATVLHAGLAESKTPMTVAAPSAAPTPTYFDAAALDQIPVAKGTNNGGVYGFGIRRADPINDGGMTVPASMGSAIGINFQPTGGGKAAITGDFVLLGSELEPVIKALRDNGIEVTAIHHHIVDEHPRLFFLHFWANDDAKKMAQGLRAALDHINVAKS